jgi:hypothetical protein
MQRASFQKTCDEKRGNLEKQKVAHSKRHLMKKEVTQKMQMGLFKRPPMKKEATPKNAKGLVSKNL